MVEIFHFKVQGLMGNKLTIVRLQFPYPMITPLEKIKIQEIKGFICHKYPALSFHTCCTVTRELTNDKSKQVIEKHTVLL